MIELLNLKVLGAAWLIVSTYLGFLGRHGVAATVARPATDAYDRRCDALYRMACVVWLGLTVLMVVALVLRAWQDVAVRWVLFVTAFACVTIVAVWVFRRGHERRAKARASPAGAERWQPPSR